MTPETRYITSPIYYVNDRPHIGHVYTTTLCDVWARFQRLLGHDVFFLTGTDEHGQKVEQSARDRGMTPQGLADENAAEFQRIMSLFGLSNDEFIRTTDPAHERQVGLFVQRLLESGDVYLGTFEGWYDAGQEEYYTENQARKCAYTSPISGRPLTRAEEENYYFRLSAFQERLEALYQAQPDLVKPEARRNEILGRLREGLQDIPISRTNFSWGIPIPGHDQHVIYVWIDALFNYATALGMAEPDGPVYAARGRYWPASYHVIGKEILWFHAAIWPALLMALGLEQPRCIYAHSFWISEGKKMSKSLGNFVDLEQLSGYIETYGRDALRWYLTTSGPLGATDADFVRSHFHEIYTTDLVNTLGNCASRVSAMIGKYCEGDVPPDLDEAIGTVDWPAFCSTQVEAVIERIDRFDLGGGLQAALAIIRRVDGFINETAPFKLARDAANAAVVGGILYRCIEAIRISACLLEAVLPESVGRLRQAWGLVASEDLRSDCQWGGIKPGQPVEKVALFPRVDAC